MPLSLMSDSPHLSALSYRPPYDWEAMLDFLSMRAIPGVERVYNGTYQRSISYNGHAGWIAVSNDGAMSALDVTIHFPDMDCIPLILSRARNMFDLAADPVAIGAALARDPVLAGLVATRPGLRVPGAWDGFEIAVRAVLGQQITVSAATRLAGKLVSAFGPEMPDHAAPMGLTHLFPSAEQLVNRDIAQIGMPRARGATIVHLAAARIADPHLFDPSQSLEEAVARLCIIPGIGTWTAHYIAMRALRESDAFPSGDIALMRALSTNQTKRISASQLHSRSEAWRPWRAYAALHLWTSDAASTPPRGKKDMAHASAD